VDPVKRAAIWAGWDLNDSQLDTLQRFGDWLREEAIVAGGLGPNESERIVERHLADSLLFAGGWRRSLPPRSVADLGSGVGLPGIPLAILWPTAAVYLVERAGRRTRLLRRALRILGLEAEVMEADASRIDLTGIELVVARAAAAPAETLKWAGRILGSGGVAVIGGSHVEPPEPCAGEEILAVPPEILDRPVWLRIMAAS
jgi:16S rRNA (guanine527-N7)-methyltransferase